MRDGCFLIEFARILKPTVTSDVVCSKEVVLLLIHCVDAPIVCGWCFVVSFLVLQSS